VLAHSLFKLYAIFFERAVFDARICRAGIKHLTASYGSSFSIVVRDSCEAYRRSHAAARTPDLPVGVADQSNRCPAKKGSPNSMRQREIRKLSLLGFHQNFEFHACFR